MEKKKQGVIELTLAKHNKITLIWVSVQEGIEDNEVADELVKVGSNWGYRDPEPFCGRASFYLPHFLSISLS